MQAERKNIDERNKMTDLERIRHSCAHVMATAIAKLWPDAQFAAGPPVENGFYYDVDLQHRISPERIPKATNGTSSFSASTAPHLKTRPRWRPISTWLRKPSAATIAKSAPRWASSPSTRSTLAQACHFGSQRAEPSSKNWKSW